MVICDNEYIRALNKQWLGIDEPTDVLSFEMADDVDEVFGHFRWFASLTCVFESGRTLQSCSA